MIPFTKTAQIINSKGILQYGYLPPDENMLRGQREYAEDNRRKIMKNYPPGKRPNDKYFAIGALGGIIIGIIIASQYNSPIAFVFGVIGGGFMGIIVVIAGQFIVSFIRKNK